MNCWEHKKCGREEGGRLVDELGVCPASKEKRTNGIHGGKNAGRCCWTIAGTLCFGEIQGSFAQKVITCLKCDFYGTVLKDMGEANFLKPSKIYMLIAENSSKKLNSY